MKDMILTLLGSSDFYRGYCPFCNASNTFGITRVGNVVSYHCFRASCGKKGVVQVGTRVGSYIGDSTKLRSDRQYLSPDNLPEYFVNPLQHTHVVEYLKNNNCLNAYLANKIKVVYDVKNNRCIFIQGDVIIGRQL